MENTKFNWPKVRIGTTPETRLQNDMVQALDELTKFQYHRAGLLELAEVSADWNLPEMAATLRDYAQKGTP